MLKINPWLKIWTSPKETLRAIKEYDPKYRFFVLCWIYGFLWMLSLSQTVSLGQFYGSTIIVLLSAILAVPIGFVMISISSLFFYWVGKLLNGKGKYKEVRAAVAWPNALSLVTIVTWVILIATYGARLFMADKGQIEPGIGLPDYMFMVQMGIIVWSTVVLIGGLAEVQGFSNIRAVANFLLVICIWVLITLGAMFAIAWLNGPSAVAFLELF